MVSFALAVLAVAVLLGFFLTFKVVPQYERGVVLTLGKFTSVRDPGLTVLVPALQTMLRADMRVQVMPVEHQDVITSDNVSVKVSAVAFYRIVDARRALLDVENIRAAILQLAPIALRANIGKHPLDALLTQQEALNAELGRALEQRTQEWGVHIQNVEIRTVDLDPTIIRAMAQEAEATRGARARIITAQGEFDAAAKLAEAATALSASPAALTLRALATLKEIGANQNTTIIFPVPQESLMAPPVSAAALALAAARVGEPRGGGNPG